jgi:hypothetical protein
MGDEIDFDVPRLGDVPVFGANRNLVFEQAARLGASIEPFLELGLVRVQAPVHLPSTHFQELTFLLCRKPEMGIDPTLPERQ